MEAGEKENARDCSNSGGRHSVHPGDRNLGLPMRAPVVLMGDAALEREIGQIFLARGSVEQ